MKLILDDISRSYGSTKALQSFAASFEPGIYALNCPLCQDTNFRFIMTPRTLNFPNVTERSGVEFGKFRAAGRGAVTAPHAAKIAL
jgi:hypothetical protein